MNRWEVQVDGLVHRVELRPGSFDRVGVVCDGVELCRLKRPDDVRPWVEQAFTGEGLPSMIVALCWSPERVINRLFIDGRDVEDGTAIHDRRAEAPTPVDEFERNINRGGTFEPEQQALAAIVGAGIWILVAVKFGVLVLIPTTIIVFLAFYGIFMAQASTIRWIGRKHAWEPHMRGLLVGFVLIAPLAALMAVGVLATR